MNSALTIQTVLLCFAVVFSILRFYVRFVLMKVRRMDDLFSLLALALYIACSTINYVLLTTIPTDFSTDIQTANGLQLGFLLALMFIAGTWAIKISFSLTLYKVVRGRAFNLSILVIAATMTIITAFQFFWTLFFCDPIRGFWEKTIRSTCKSDLSWVQAMYVHGAIIMCADLGLGVVIPILLLRQLHLPLALKISVGITLAVGSLATVATIVRMVYIYQAPNVTNNMGYLPLGIWVNVELGISIICTSATTLKPLLVQMKIVSSSTGAEKFSTPRRIRESPNHQIPLDEISLRTKQGAGNTSLDDRGMWDDGRLSAEAMSVV